MKIDDKAIDYLEQHIPELAEAATKQAYWQALASGSSVLIAEGNALIEVFPDGTRQFIKNIEPRIPINKEEKLQIK